MSRALETLLGEHDFSSFRSTGCSSPSPVKTISVATLETVEDTGVLPGARRHTILLRGSGFLYHQVWIFICRRLGDRFPLVM